MTVTSERARIMKVVQQEAASGVFRIQDHLNAAKPIFPEEASEMRKSYAEWELSISKVPWILVQTASPLRPAWH